MWKHLFLGAPSVSQAECAYRIPYNSSNGSQHTALCCTFPPSLSLAFQSKLFTVLSIKHYNSPNKCILKEQTKKRTNLLKEECRSKHLPTLRLRQVRSRAHAHIPTNPHLQSTPFTNEIESVWPGKWKVLSSGPVWMPFQWLLKCLIQGILLSPPFSHALSNLYVTVRSATWLYLLSIHPIDLALERVLFFHRSRHIMMCVLRVRGLCVCVRAMVWV